MQPILAQSIADATLGSWVDGAQKAVQHLPPIKPPGTAILPPTPPVPPAKSLLYPGDEEPLLHFPGLDEAVRKLQERQVVTADEFYKLSAAARQNAFTISGDLTAASIDKVRQVLGEQLEHGPSLKELARAVHESVDSLPIGEAHLEQVYRNAVNESYSQGMEAVLEHPIVSDGFPYRGYYSIHDARARPEHTALDKLGLNHTNVYYRLDPTWLRFRPPWSWGCLTSGTVVQGRIKTAMRFWYEGKLVKLITRGGKNVTVTVNHPILTDRGFVAAGELKRGDHVVAYSSGVALRENPARGDELPFAVDSSPQSVFPSPGLDEDYPPAKVEQVFTALSHIGTSLTRKASPDDFHGDATGGDGDIEIVTIDRELLFDLESTDATQCIRDGGLPAMNGDLASKTSASHFGSLFIGSNAAGGGSPRGGALPLDSLRIGLDELPFHSLRIGSAASLDTSRFQHSPDGRSINAKPAGNRLDGFTALVGTKHIGESLAKGVGNNPIPSAVDNTTGLLDAPNKTAMLDAYFARDLRERFPSSVAFDDIVEIADFDFSGHVYDVQTEGGWVVADDLIVSNCRCGWIALSVKTAAEMGVHEAQEWLRTGVEPVHEFVTPPPFSPPPGWERVETLV